MDRTITQRQLRDNTDAVLGAVQGGQTLIITRSGKPVAELRPVQQSCFVPRAVIAEASMSAMVKFRQAGSL